MSFVDPASVWYSASVFVIIHVIFNNIGPRYNGTRLYYANFLEQQGADKFSRIWDTVRPMVLLKQKNYLNESVVIIMHIILPIINLLYHNHLDYILVYAIASLLCGSFLRKPKIYIFCNYCIYRNGMVGKSFFIVDTMDADNLVTQWVIASATMALTWFRRHLRPQHHNYLLHWKYCADHCASWFVCWIHVIISRVPWVKKYPINLSCTIYFPEPILLSHLWGHLYCPEQLEIGCQWMKSGAPLLTGTDFNPSMDI